MGHQGGPGADYGKRWSSKGSWLKSVPVNGCDLNKQTNKKADPGSPDLPIFSKEDKNPNFPTKYTTFFRSAACLKC